MEYLFVENLRENFLFQHVLCCTRYREGCDPSCIDLIITDNENDINYVNIFPSLGHSDHCVLLSEYCCSQREIKAAEDVTFLKYDNFDYISFCEEWSTID